MIKLFEKVKIKSENLIGTVVDISNKNGKMVFIVESDTEGEIEGRSGGIFPLYDCSEDEIEKI
ncbi:MAG: hypothetical protein NC394_08505 [Bacteroides sp.]|nr:hypothetical protein [Bacteroides sp.]